MGPTFSLPDAGPIPDRASAEPASRIACHLHVVLNGSAGGVAERTRLRERIEAGLRAAGAVGVTVDDDHSRPLAERVQAAAAGDAPIVVAAGGDGTATALAAALLGSGKALALLPLGTANLLARDLGIPLVLDEAMAALATMQPRRIDVGEVAGRVFLHKVVIGLAPAIAAGRERIRHRRDLGALLGFARFLLRQLARPRDMRLVLRVDGAPEETVRVRAVAIANNAYDEGLGRFFARARLDRGHLTVYALRRLGRRDALRLSLGMLFGRWRSDEALEERQAASVDLSTRRRLVQAMVDGEVVRLSPPLRFKIRPAALTVLAPARRTDTAAPEEDASPCA